MGDKHMSKACVPASPVTAKCPKNRWKTCSECKDGNGRMRERKAQGHG